MRWVLPRVICLQNERPEIVVEVTAAVSHGVDFGGEQFDAAIVFGTPSLKSVVSHHLFDEVLTPVCAPEVWKSHRGKTLLHPTRDRRDWLRWLNAYGYPGLPSAKAQHFDTLDLAISSAMQGLGVAIGDLSLIEKRLAHDTCDRAVLAVRAERRGILPRLSGTARAVDRLAAGRTMAGSEAERTRGWLSICTKATGESVN